MRQGGRADKGKCTGKHMTALSIASTLLLAGLLSGVGDSARTKGLRLPSDTDMLRRAEIKTDDKSLLQFLRTRTLTDKELENPQVLIQQLASDTFAQRETAQTKLINLGPLALSVLRRASQGTDPETRRRARASVETIEAESRRSLPLAVVRLLLSRRPPEMTDALVRYLPFAWDDAVKETIYFGLDAATKQASRIDNALIDALTDRIAERRALAACIVGRRGTDAARHRVRRLLLDSSDLVRLRAAQGLLAAGDTTSIPILTSLLAEGSIKNAWQAEELLNWVATGTRLMSGSTLRTIC
jgi:hypothetical protein